MEANQHYLYVVFAATPYRMGQMIRLVTREPYNHVAIALEEDLSELYAFARRYYRTPLYGGFVTEHPYRYHHQGRTADICLCRLPIDEAAATALRRRLDHMRDHAQHYLYNHLSALAAPIHRKISVPDAFTCAEFAVSVLCEMGYDFDMDRFYTIGDIASQLAPYRVYEGSFPTPATPDPGFFSPNPIAHPFRTSVRDILALLKRRSSGAPAVSPE